jgi:hypothetical protein
MVPSNALHLLVKRRISMPESEWAKKLAREFKAGKAQKAEEDAKLREEQRARKEAASNLWTEVREAFKHKAQIFNAAVGEEILLWEAASVNTFTLRRKDIEGCLNGSYQEAAYEIKIEVLGRVVPFEVALEYRTRKYELVGADNKPAEPDELARTLTGELLGKH